MLFTTVLAQTLQAFVKACLHTPHAILSESFYIYIYNTCVHIYVYIHISKYMCTHVYMYICTHVYTHIYIFAYMIHV